MASTFSSKLRFELIADGEKAGTWGSITNTNLGTLIETAIAGFKAIAVTVADVTLTTANGTDDQARSMGLDITGAATAARAVIVPSSSKMYVVRNSNTGTAGVQYAITVKTAAGTGIIVLPGEIAVLWCDGTNVVRAATCPGSLVTQEATAFTTSGTAPNFVLTPTNALIAYAAGQRYRVKFHAVGAGTDQLNISSLGNKAVKTYDSAGAKVAFVPTLNFLTDVEYDGTDFVVLNQLPASAASVVSPAQVQNQTYTAFTTAGTSAAFTLTPTPAIAANTDDAKFFVNFNAAPTGTPTLAVSGLTALPLKYRDNTGALQTLTATQCPSGWETDVFTDGTNWILANIPPPAPAPAVPAMTGLGYGQTYQDVTASRSLGTTFSNTTGKPIQVMVNGVNSSTGASYYNVTVAGVTFHSESEYAITTFYGSSVTFIVPVDASYSVASGFGILNLTQWFELR